MPHQLSQGGAALCASARMLLVSRYDVRNDDIYCSINACVSISRTVDIEQTVASATTLTEACKLHT